MKKIKLVGLIFSLILIVCGILLLIFSCDGSCYASNHGGMLDWVCPKFSFPSTSSIVMIVVGGIGVITSTILLLIPKFRSVKKDS